MGTNRKLIALSFGLIAGLTALVMALQAAKGAYASVGLAGIGWTVGSATIAVGALFLLWRGISAKPPASNMTGARARVRGPMLGAALSTFVGSLLLAPVLLTDLVADGKANVDILAAIVILVAVLAAGQITYGVIQGRSMRELNARLESRVRSRTAEFEARYRMARSISGAVDLTRLVEEALPFARRAATMDACCLILAPEVAPSQELGLIAWEGASALKTVDLSEWTEDRTPFVLSQYVTWFTEVGEARCNLLRVPLRSGNEVLGSFLAFRIDAQFDWTTREQLESTALEIASGIARVVMYEKAVFAAERDYLTGLLNHRAISQQFHKHFEDMDNALPLGLVLLDIGNFKLLNDTHGHSVGDEVLRLIGRTLADLSSVHGVIGRTGGDEFMLLLPGFDLQRCYAFGAKIQERVRELTIQVRDHEGEIPVEVNLGIASYPESSSIPYHVLGKADRNLNEAKASQVAFVPESSKHHANFADAQSYDSLDLILTAIDNIDSYTRRHSIDVCRYATWIAEDLGDSADTVRTIGLAAMVHDVGKIAVPGQILRKPAALTDEEYNVLKQHTTIGAMIVQAIPGMDEMIPGVLSHHERWDGRGYPEGLKGEEIPHMGRVIAVADALSAMTTDRPYRKGMSFDEAARRIQEGIGSQFCPLAGPAILRALRRNGMIDMPDRKAA